MLFNLLDSYPKSKKNIAKRQINKDLYKKIALKFGRDYFDGKRCYGYGGYKYDGRWKPIAKKIIDHYNLDNGNKILDIGCAKGYLIKDLFDINNSLNLTGIDISQYAVDNCHPDVSAKIINGNATDLPFADNYFDMVLSINTFHNLKRKDCIKALTEMKRVCKNKKMFVQVDAYNNNIEKEIFLNWMLTAKTHGTPKFWEKIFNEAGYDGDYYWTFV